MTDANCFEAMSNLQLLQDMLSEEYNLFMVLIDQNANELTLPSKLPLSCYENGLKNAECRNCLAACLAKPPEGLREPSLYHCHCNLFYTVFKTNIYYIKPVYLVAGFTAEPDALPATRHCSKLYLTCRLPWIIRSIGYTTIQSC